MMAMGQGGGIKHSNKNSKQRYVKRATFWGGEEKKKKSECIIQYIIKRRGMHNVGWLSNYLA